MRGDLIKELDAKAWQSSRGGGKDRKEHCCYRAAREIERLRAIGNATDAEKGWRSFWNGFSDFLNLGTEQRSYGWHDLMEACERGMDAVKRDVTPREKPRPSDCINVMACGWHHVRTEPEIGLYLCGVGGCPHMIQAAKGGLGPCERLRNAKILAALDEQRKEFEADPSKARAFLMKLGCWNEDGTLKDGDPY